MRRKSVAKCGDIRVRHWAHKGHLVCDPWWENETKWHRDWKDHFPTNWQEVVHRAADGERHIADVTTGEGWVIEFQHSYLRPEERRSRDAFYPKLIGLAEKSDSSGRIAAVSKEFCTPDDWFSILSPAPPSPAFRDAVARARSPLHARATTR